MGSAEEYLAKIGGGTTSYKKELARRGHKVKGVHFDKTPEGKKIKKELEQEKKEKSLSKSEKRKVKTVKKEMQDRKVLLPSSDGKQWKQDIDPKTGKVRFVSGTKSTAWRTPKEWGKATKRQRKETGTKKLLYTTDKKKYIKTYVGKSGLAKMPKEEKAVVTRFGEKAGFLSSGVTQRIKKEPRILMNVSQETKKILFPDAEESMQYVVGKAGKKKLLMSPGLSKKYKKQLPEIMKLYKKDTKGFKDYWKDSKIGAFKYLGSEVKAIFRRGVQETKREPLQAVKDVFDPKTWDIGIRRASLGFQKTLGIEYFRSEKGFQIMTKEKAMKDNLKPVMNEINKEFSKLSPVGKTTSFVAGIGSLKVSTLPVGYFSTPFVKSQFKEVLSPKDKKGIRTSFSKLTSKYQKPTFFKQKDITSYSYAKTGKGVSQGVIESFKKTTQGIKGSLYRFGTKGKPLSLGRTKVFFRNMKIGAKQVVQKGEGVIIKGAKFKLDNFGRLILKKVKPTPKMFKYRGEEVFFPKGITQKITGKGDTFSFMRGSARSLSKPFTESSFTGIRQYLSDSFKNVKLGSMKGLRFSVSKSGGVQQVRVSGGLKTITKSLKSADIGTLKALKQVQAPSVAVTLGKVAGQEAGTYGIMSVSPLESKGGKGLKTLTLPKEKVIKDLTKEGDLKVVSKDIIKSFNLKNIVKETDSVKLLGDSRTKSRSRTILEPKEELKELTRPETSPDVIGKEKGSQNIFTIIEPRGLIKSDQRVSPLTNIKLDQVIRSRLKLSTQTISIGSVPPPPPIEPFIQKPPLPIVLPDFGELEEEGMRKSLKRFRGFKEIDIWKDLKGESLFKGIDLNPLKEIKLPKIKI